MARICSQIFLPDCTAVFPSQDALEQAQFQRIATL